MSMSHFCRAWWARWGLGSLAGGKRYHFSPGYTTGGRIHGVQFQWYMLVKILSTTALPINNLK